MKKMDLSYKNILQRLKRNEDEIICVIERIEEERVNLSMIQNEMETTITLLQERIKAEKKS